MFLSIVSVNLDGVSSVDERTTFVNYDYIGDIQRLIEIYTHEAYHNLMRFLMKNTDAGFHSPKNNKLLVVSTSKLIEYRDRDYAQNYPELAYIEKIYQQKPLSLSEKYKLLPVEAGDYFDFNVRQKAIWPDPYSLLMNKEYQFTKLFI